MITDLDNTVAVLKLYRERYNKCVLEFRRIEHPHLVAECYGEGSDEHIQALAEYERVFSELTMLYKVLKVIKW